MLVNLKVNEFINEVDSKSPAPGGGSVSALASSLGASLVRMMQHLSFGKKKYEANDEDVKAEFSKRFEALGAVKDRLVQLVDEDTEAFNQVMKAFKMPKETDEEKKVRKAAIAEATMGAIEVPHEIARLSLEALELMYALIPAGNKNAITDLGVGALLLQAGLEGAVLNVKINLGGVEAGEEIAHEVDKMVEQGRNLRDKILEKVNEYL